MLLIMVYIQDLPNELLEHILYNVDQDTLRSKCTDVSISWRKILQSLSFWKRYHRYWCNPDVSYSCQYPSIKLSQNKYIPDDMFRGDYNWSFFSFINPLRNPFETNLLMNSDGNEVSVNELQMQENRYFEG